MINHAPHLKMGWEWIHVPDADFYVWNHKNVYTQLFILAADQPGHRVGIITALVGEIERGAHACPATSL